MTRIGPEEAVALEQRDLAQAAKAAIAELAIAARPGPPGARAGPAATRAVIATDRPDRVALRLDRINRNDPNAVERLLGARDIVSINFFERGLRAARAVCRIKTLGAAGGPPDYATGFLVAPSLLVTNNHVLPDPETASRSLAEFGLELDRNFVERRGRIFPFVPGEAFHTSAELDFTVVAISPVGHDGTPITDFGLLPLIPASGKGLAGEHVSIIQHPGGETKQVVVRENRIIALDVSRFPGVHPAFLHYTADTERGSSGSPVFNDQWELIAIHHLAIVDRDEAGRPLNRAGAAWTEADGEDAKRWIGNEGLRVSALWRHLREAAPFDAGAARIMEMLALDPHAAHRPRPARDEAPPQPWQALPGVPDAEAFESTRFAAPAFAGSLGYRPDFLGATLAIPLPRPGPGFRGVLATNADTGGEVFDYTHFSLAMHAGRRLAAWTAVNIAGDELQSSRKEPGWRRDRRLPAEQQTLAEVYGRVPGKAVQIDRGHLVRRLDPVWGPQEVADRAAADTYHYTNAAPQEHVFNSEIWGNLEDFVLARADALDHRATVLTGPILRPDDNFFGEDLQGGPWQIPWSFWKIAAFVRPDGTPSVTGFVVEQTPTITPIFETTRYNPYTPEEARVFQRPIAVIEELTGLDLGPLRGLDRMGEVESTSAAAARPIRGPRDILF